jgi:hypothetical protein
LFLILLISNNLGLVVVLYVCIGVKGVGTARLGVVINANHTMASRGVLKGRCKPVNIFAQKNLLKALIKALRIITSIATIIVLKGLYPTFAAL